MVYLQLVADKKMTSNSAVHFLCCVLFGLQQHGEHEGCQASLLSLGLQTYELLVCTSHFCDRHSFKVQ